MGGREGDGTDRRSGQRQTSRIAPPIRISLKIVADRSADPNFKLNNTKHDKSGLTPKIPKSAATEFNLAIVACGTFCDSGQSGSSRGTRT